MKTNLNAASPLTTESTNPEPLVRIFWIDTRDGNCGNGQPITRAEAESVLADVSPRHPSIQHWIVEE